MTLTLRTQNKRSLNEEFDPHDIIWVDGNTTRKATDEELRDVFGFHKCSDADCSAEKSVMGIESIITLGVPKTSPAIVIASTTSQMAAAVKPSSISIADSRVTSPVLPQVTSMPSDKLRVQMELRALLEGGSR